MKILIVGGKGYIGSFLVEQWINHKDFDVAMIDQLGSNGVKYQSLSSAELCKFDSIVWLAGHSSVRQSLDDPVGTLSNNLVDLYEFGLKLESSQEFIYASSASVYHRTSNEIASETDELGSSLNTYDLSKKWFDELAQSLPCKTYGLRFGTVSGPSPKFRDDLIINAMTISALRHQEVRIQNGGMWRSILGINDLVSAVSQILSEKPNPGVYNVASFSSTIEDIGTQIGLLLSVPLQINEGTGTYNFRISTHKLESIGWKATETLDSIVNKIVGWVN
jgi:UDP-glucose 4-epimerase